MQRRAALLIVALCVGAVLGCSRSARETPPSPEIPGILQQQQGGSPQEAAERLHAGCMAGDLAICQRWLAVLRKGCDLQGSEACIMLAGYSMRGLKVGDTVVVERNPAEAASILEKHCQAGNRPGCEALAAIYYKGIGVERDPERAAQLLCAGGKMTKLPVSLASECARGDASACGVLQRCCAMGSQDACEAGKPERKPQPTP